MLFILNHLSGYYFWAKAAQLFSFKAGLIKIVVSVPRDYRLKPVAEPLSTGPRSPRLGPAKFRNLGPWIRTKKFPNLAVRESLSVPLQASPT